MYSAHAVAVSPSHGVANAKMAARHHTPASSAAFSPSRRRKHLPRRRRSGVPHQPSGAWETGTDANSHRLGREERAMQVVGGHASEYDRIIADMAAIKARQAQDSHREREELEHRKRVLKLVLTGLRDGVYAEDGAQVTFLGRGASPEDRRRMQASSSRPQPQTLNRSHTAPQGCVPLEGCTLCSTLITCCHGVSQIGQSPIVVASCTRYP